MKPQNRHAPLAILTFSAFSLFLIAAAILIGRLMAPAVGISPVDAEPQNPITIVVDAGHGGRDGGTSADDGTPEKDYNLAVAKKLAALLKTANVRVVMTRSTDIELASPTSSHKKRDDLNARLELAEKEPNTLFVSIHMNSFPVEKYSGLQVYYSGNNSESKPLADAIQNGAATYLDAKNKRKTKCAGEEIYLLSHMRVPSVLVECGFLSNHAEAALLKTESYREKLAMSIYLSILEYIGSETGL